MNESLAKQLHDLIRNYKISIADEINDSIRKVNTDLDNLENDVKEIIEKTDIKEGK